MPREFTAITLPGSRKVAQVTSEGIYEHLIYVDPTSPAGKMKQLAGIWVFKVLPDYQVHAVPIRPAEAHEKTELFDNLKLPQVGILPVVKTSVWFALPLNTNQYRKYVKAKAPLPLFFAPENISIFDPILARVYKHRRTLLIYEDINERYPTEEIQKLRHGLETWRECGVADLHLPRELHTAFKLAVESEVPPLERLVKYSLRLAEAQFQSLTDLGSGQHRVGYSYKGHSDSVVIDDNLTVIDAGICLNGHDRDFDLSSIVFVKARGVNRA